MRDPSVLRCRTPRCEGTLWSVNDGAGRFLALSNRMKLRCDRCGSEFAVDVPRITSPHLPAQWGG